MARLVQVRFGRAVEAGDFMVWQAVAVKVELGEAGQVEVWSGGHGKFRLGVARSGGAVDSGHGTVGHGSRGWAVGDRRGSVRSG